MPTKRPPCPREQDSLCIWPQCDHTRCLLPNPISVSLEGEARDVAAELAKRHGVSEAAVVARALGLLWWLDEEIRSGSRVTVENHGETRPVNIHL